MGRVEEPRELPQAWNLVRRGADRLVRWPCDGVSRSGTQHHRRAIPTSRVFTSGRILLVIFCEKHGGSVVRIISARKPHRRRRRPMKKEYDLRKLKRRSGAAKSDREA